MLLLAGHTNVTRADLCLYEKSLIRKSRADPCDAVSVPLATSPLEYRSQREPSSAEKKNEPWKEVDNVQKGRERKHIWFFCNHW